MCEKCLYCYANPSLQPTNPDYRNDVDNQQTLFFTYLHNTLDSTEISLDKAYVQSKVQDRLGQCLLWDDTQRAYYIQILSVSVKALFIYNC